MQRAILGIKGTPINDDQQLMDDAMKKQVKDLGAVDGVWVREIIEGGSAAGKLQENDVIIGIDSKRVKNFAELQEGLAKHRPGDKVTVKVLRDKKEKDIELTLKNEQGTTKVVKNAGMPTVTGYNKRPRSQYSFFLVLLIILVLLFVGLRKVKENQCLSIADFRQELPYIIQNFGNVGDGGFLLPGDCAVCISFRF